MLGAVKAAIGSGRGVITVTEGSSSGAFPPPDLFFGYRGAGLETYGSISPQKYNGVQIQALYYSTLFNPNDVFYLILDGNLSQSFFKTVATIDHTLQSASASTFSYDAGYDYTIWTWDSLTKPSSWDGTGTSIVDIFYN